uniref:Retrotransposon gag domain-containing protein n=1 Tax=Oryza meridionalis TaxID=40149 RepID=A0A0E0DCG4_9ORYZ
MQTSKEVWQALERMYASQSRARVINTRLALATTQKGNLSVAQYVNKMKGYADEMASAGRRLDDEELVSYILAGLDIEFNPVGGSNSGSAFSASRGSNGGHGNGGYNNSAPRPTCHLCNKVGHTVAKCFKRFDASFTGEEKMAASAVASYGIDTNWYTDTGATDHIMGELDKLTVLPRQQPDPHRERCRIEQRRKLFSKAGVEKVSTL